MEFYGNARSTGLRCQHLVNAVSRRLFYVTKGKPLAPRGRMGTKTSTIKRGHKEEVCQGIRDSFLAERRLGFGGLRC